MYIIYKIVNLFLLYFFFSSSKCTIAFKYLYFNSHKDCTACDIFIKNISQRYFFIYDDFYLTNR